MCDNVIYTELMDEIQDKIREATDFDKFCLLHHGVCVNEQTLTNFFDPEYFLPSQVDYKGANLSYTLEPTSNPNFIEFFVPSKFIYSTAGLSKNYTTENINRVVQYWAEYDAGHGPPEDYAQKYYNGEKMAPKFYYQTNGDNYQVGNLFGGLASKTFAFDSPLDTDVEMALSIFQFGLPLEGYDTANDKIDEQQVQMLVEIHLCTFSDIH